MSKYINTRDLYKRQQELQSLKYAAESAQEERDEAEAALFDHDIEKQFADLELQEAHDEKTKGLEEVVSNAESALEAAQADFGDDEQTELEELDDLESEVSEWRHGETLIPVDSFEDYARDFADEIGAIDTNAKWPLTCIDWEQAAKDLAMDYTEVSYQGDDYYVRS